ncbi:MAG: DUF1007 family protein [bacterium]
MKRLLFILGFAVLVGGPMWAHPHMFIDSQVTAVFDQQQLKGFWIEWKFDEMFTSSIRIDYDRNRDGEFNDQETRLIEQNAFANLKNYNYFITITHGDKAYRADQVEKFDAWMEDDRLVYKFFVPYSLSISGAQSTVKLIIFDDTFFCDIAYVDEKPVSIEGLQYVSAGAEIKKNRDAGVNYDPTGGRTRGNGDGAGNASGQAYPYELYLSFKNK